MSPEERAGLKRLTAKQRELLVLVSDPIFRVHGLSISGTREFRTARSLHQRGLANLNVSDQLTITESGRRAASLLQGQSK